LIQSLVETLISIFTER